MTANSSPFELYKIAHSLANVGISGRVVLFFLSFSPSLIVFSPILFYLQNFLGAHSGAHSETCLQCLLLPLLISRTSISPPSSRGSLFSRHVCGSAS